MRDTFVVLVNSRLYKSKARETLMGIWVLLGKKAGAVAVWNRS